MRFRADDAGPDDFCGQCDVCGLDPGDCCCPAALKDIPESLRGWVARESEKGIMSLGVFAWSGSSEDGVRVDLHSPKIGDRLYVRVEKSDRTIKDSLYECVASGSWKDFVGIEYE